MGDIMFYQLEDDIVSISFDEINRGILTIGYVDVNELGDIYKSLGFSTQAFEECRENEMLFSPKIELFDDYCLIKLDIDELGCHTALFVAKNLLLAVTPVGSKISYRDIFMKLTSRISCPNATEEKITAFFFEELMDSYKNDLEKMQSNLSVLETAVFSESTDNNFNKSILLIKNDLLSYRSLYEQVIEICERLAENENELFNPKELKSLKTFARKADRFKEKIDLLRDSVNHIWDSYQAYLDIKLNQSMKIFTLLTTIFFPITIIVGWYGMNFKYIPEFDWKYGYVYVVVLTVAVVCALCLWLKKRKWL